MKKTILILLLVVSFGVAGYTFYTAWRLQDPQFQRERTLGDTRMFQIADSAREAVDLDELVQLRPDDEGARKIGPLRPITFDAKVKQAPRTIETGYLQTAFGVLNVEPPLPVVTQRMFIETQAGNIIPVYVWDEAAALFSEGNAPQQMLGFHIYTYSKGPAIVVDGVVG